MRTAAAAEQGQRGGPPLWKGRRYFSRDPVTSGGLAAQLPWTEGPRLPDSPRFSSDTTSARRSSWTPHILLPRPTEDPSFLPWEVERRNISTSVPYQSTLPSQKSNKNRTNAASEAANSQTHLHLPDCCQHLWAPQPHRRVGLSRLKGGPARHPQGNCAGPVRHGPGHSAQQPCRHVREPPRCLPLAPRPSSSLPFISRKLYVLGHFTFALKHWLQS